MNESVYPRVATGDCIGIKSQNKLTTGSDNTLIIDDTDGSFEVWAKQYLGATFSTNNQ